MSDGKPVPTFPDIASSSATPAETIDEAAIALAVDLLEVVEKSAPLTHQLEETAPGMVVLDVALEMLGEIGDPLGEDRDLDLRRAGIAARRGVFLDQCLLTLGRDRHRVSF